MIRPLALATLLFVTPLAPAVAVIAIEAPVPVTAAAAPKGFTPSDPVGDAPVFLGMTTGELAAGILGLLVIGLALVGSRQPHSVAS